MLVFFAAAAAACITCSPGVHTWRQRRAGVPECAHRCESADRRALADRLEHLRDRLGHRWGLPGAGAHYPGGGRAVGGGVRGRDGGRAAAGPIAPVNRRDPRGNTCQLRWTAWQWERCRDVQEVRPRRCLFSWPRARPAHRADRSPAVRPEAPAAVQTGGSAGGRAGAATAAAPAPVAAAAAASGRQRRHGRRRHGRQRRRQRAAAVAPAAAVGAAAAAGDGRRGRRRSGAGGSGGAAPASRLPVRRASPAVPDGQHQADRRAG